MGLLLGVELQGHATNRCDALQHRKRVSGVLGILKAGNHGLRSAHLLSKFSLGQTRILSHLAHQESQVNLMQGPLKSLAVGGALSRTPFDNLAVPVALEVLKPNSCLSLSKKNSGRSCRARPYVFLFNRHPLLPDLCGLSSSLSRQREAS
jgi:hypothetical protein